MEVSSNSQLLTSTPNNSKYVLRRKYCRILSVIAIICSLILIATLCILYIPSSQSQSKSSKSSSLARDILTYDVLMGISSAPNSYVDYSAMAIPDDAEEVDFEFSGTLSISMTSSIGFQVVEDWYNYGNNAARRYLPPIQADIVSDGSHIIPVIRYNTRTSHPYWEYILSSGRLWKENDDHGYQRAAIPFTITQKNAQCAHNGVFMFLFNENGDISNVWHQITQETCLYFKANYWGLITNVNYDAKSIANANTIKQEYATEIENRIPTKPIADMAQDLGVDPTRFGSTSDGMDPQQITMFGVYYDGINYVGAYPTRSGEYPYPEQLIGPSYSTAKSAFVGVAAMYLQHKYGGIFGSDDILDIAYSGSGSNRWTDVTYDNCIDMATGNYWQPSWMTDEGLLAVENGFFLPETHDAKYSHSTTYYNRRASSPGQTWVYHSSDHYLCGFGFQRFLRQQSNDASADIYDEIYENIYKQIGCSDVLKQSKRTYDSQYQAFSSHGLFFNRDDIVKISNFLNINHGRIGAQQVLDLHEMRSSLQLTNDKGLGIGRADDTQNNAWYYQNGFWSARKLWTLRQCVTDIPLMRGYGGIHVSMYPNHATYYFFNDNDDKEWLVAADEINNIQSFC